MTGEQGDNAFRARSNFGTGGDNSFAGALSFLRRRYSRDLDGVDVVVSGVPYDGATTNRPGSRFGPRAIRAASTEVAALDHFPGSIPIFDTLNVVDYGDCHFDPGHSHRVSEVVEAHASEILVSGAKMLTFGGDHYVTYPLLKAHAERHGPLSLLHFDAHSDTWPDDGTRLDHGSMFLRAVEDGIVDPERSVQVGIRTANESTFGFTILTAPWVHREGIPATLEQIKRVIGDHKTYLTFDIDCLDPAFAPGTGTPVPGGLSSSQAIELIRGLGSLNLIGFDVVEVAPAYDHAEITALAAATLAQEMLALLAVQKGAEPLDLGPGFMV